MAKYLLAHDLGTSGNKATLYTLDGDLVRSITCSYDAYFFNGNWAEQDAHDWWKAVCHSTKALLEDLDARDVQSVCFSGQMMGCLCVDRNGEPLRKSIIWADQRSVEEIRQLREKLDLAAFYRITGHRLSPSYSLGKLLWIRRHEPEIYKHTFKMLNAKDYIVYKLTGRFITDYSDASGTNLFDINRLQWSADILKAAEIEADILPEAKPSTHIAGMVTPAAAEQTGLYPGTPVVCGGGDGVCAAVGAGCVRENTAYNYVGSSSWIGLTTRRPVYDASMRTFNWVHIVPGYYSPCGTMQAAGGSFSWLKDEICALETHLAEQKGASPYEFINKLAEESVPGAHGLLYLPYLIGERSPRWNEDARGAFIGMKMEHRRSDLVRAVYEGVFLNLNIILDIFREHTGIRSMTAIGGGAKGVVQQQIMADIYEMEIAVLEHLEEATSMGAAVTGGVGVGIYPSFDEIRRFIRVSESRKPNPGHTAKYRDIKPVFDAAYRQLVPVYDALKNI